MKTNGTSNFTTAPKFNPGRFFATPGALQEIPPAEMAYAMYRHLRGDWGNVDKVDWKENELGLEEGFRLFSVYRTKAGTKFWIITEADRSATTVLLPNEY
ncbi:MAG: hypothetical protein H6822_19200 [Planctomycetaceae bacterium]|nr:hypothetical protein [Planctomycetaceae bacterium]